MLDRQTRSSPDWCSMIATCRRKVRTEEMQLCEETFSRLYQHHLQHGHIPDSLFDELGYPQDVDPNGTIVRRDSDIESYQRAKTLSHHYQRSLRAELKRQEKEKEDAKLVELQSKATKLLDVNKACEEKLCVAMGLDVDNVEGMMFANASLENFSKCNYTQLKVFIHARRFESHAIPKESNWRWPSKKANIVDLAFQYRSTLVKLTVPSAAATTIEVDSNTASNEPTIVD